MANNEIINYNDRDYKITLNDFGVIVTVQDKEVYKITKDVNVVIKDQLDIKSFEESQNMLFRMAKADIESGLVEKNAKTKGLI